MPTTPLKVSPIPAFNDNYIWLLETTGQSCAVVDPGEPEPVIEALDQRGLQLDAILVTHHHADHIGGIPTLLKRWPAQVIGPDDPRVGRCDRVVEEGGVAELSTLGLRFKVIEVPGHTRSHIAYFGHGALFCGDTLFSVGCGRLFEGTPEQMQSSLDKLAHLPPDTKVYCAHEYTQSNCTFALAVEPENHELRKLAKWVDARRKEGAMTLPTTLGRECAVNPFLRTREPSVMAAARRLEQDVRAGASTLAVIRAWKDRF
jgi:hydroxyacylglutathione hydrolase